jgi:hypothetical protein
MQGISQLKRLLNFFKKSSFANRHLSAVRVRMQISRGLESIGNTRFSAIYYAAESVDRCLMAIRLLVNDGTIEVKGKVRLFETQPMLQCQ